MLKRLSALRLRERRLALTLALLVGSWVILAWMVQPLWDRGAQLGAQVEQHTERLHAVGRLLAQAPVIERRQQELADFLTPEPDDGTRGFLDQLEGLSRSSNVRLNLKPKPPKPSGHQSRVEVEVEVEGSQETLLRFLDELFRLPKLVTVQQLRIAHAPTKEAALRANLLIEKLTLLAPDASSPN